MPWDLTMPQEALEIKSAVLCRPSTELIESDLIVGTIFQHWGHTFNFAECQTKTSPEPQSIFYIHNVL